MPKPGSLPLPAPGRHPIGHALPLEQFVLLYDSRSDGGPRMVGPFGSYIEALEHHDGLHLARASFNVAELTHPDDDRNQEEQ